MTGSARWLAIFTAHRQRMVAEATRVTGDATSAEDVVQDAWLRLSHGATDTRIIEPASYLRRVVRNLALDQYWHRPTRALYSPAPPSRFGPPRRRATCWGASGPILWGRSIVARSAGES
jgi:DNA-directed RNA polymerase specialized sigma24 family protein